MQAGERDREGRAGGGRGAQQRAFPEPPQYRFAATDVRYLRRYERSATPRYSSSPFVNQITTRRTVHDKRVLCLLEIQRANSLLDGEQKQ